MKNAREQPRELGKSERGEIGQDGTPSGFSTGKYMVVVNVKYGVAKESSVFSLIIFLAKAKKKKKRIVTREFREW